MTRRSIARTTPVLSMSLFFVFFAFAPSGRTQVTNYLTANNGSETLFVLPGQSTAGGIPNLYWRCFDRDLWWAPLGAGTFTGIDLTGWQWATSIKGTFLAGTPLFYFVEDPTLSCLISAAVGGGFPPNRSAITASPNTLAAFYFYTSVPSTAPIAWWFAFTGSAFAGKPRPALGGGHLLLGWSDPNFTTTFSFAYTVGSSDETSAAQSMSRANLNAAGLGVFQPPSTVEWGMEMMTREPTDNPERIGDPGGAGGYSPVAGGSGIRFRTFATQHAGTGCFPIFLMNFAFGGGAAAHVPGITLLGTHVPLNLDPLFIALLGLPFVGPPITALAPIGPFWNPNAGWTVGGQSLSPPFPMPAGAAGLVFGLASFTFSLGGPCPPQPPSLPATHSSSNGSRTRGK